MILRLIVLSFNTNEPGLATGGIIFVPYSKTTYDPFYQFNKRNGAAVTIRK